MTQRQKRSSDAQALFQMTTEESGEASSSVAEEAGLLVKERRKPLVGRFRFLVLGALLAQVIVVFIPPLFNLPLTTLRLEGVTTSLVIISLVWAFVATVAGYGFIRQLTAYPGVRTSTYILPSLFASYGIASLLMFYFRIDYSRYVLLASLLSAVIWFYVAFFLKDRHATPTLALIPNGNQRNIVSIAGANWVRLSSVKSGLSGIEGVVADLHSDFPKTWERFIAKCVLAGIPVYDVKNVIESLTGRVDIEHLAENSFGSILPSNFYLRLKRIVDLFLAMVFLPFFMVVIVVAAVAIRLETAGPAFYTQPRMGFRAHIFTIYKLRSMRADVKEGNHFTESEDPRITNVGRFLRKYRIDELPQIFNIIKGDMSWIGPRPEAVQLADWYAQEIPFYIYRHAVRPGISGWAQVNQGNVAKLDAATVKLQFDFYYIKNFSPWLDFLIVLKTFRTIFTGFGSK